MNVILVCLWCSVFGFWLGSFLQVSEDERGLGSIQEDEKWELRSSDDGFLVTVWDGLVCGKRLGCSAKEMIEGEMRDNGFSDGVVMQGNGVV